MGFGPAYSSGGGYAEIFTKKDGQPAIFADTAARDAYFAGTPTELMKLMSKGDAVGIGNANQITAAYVYKANKWEPIATNFKGTPGTPGKQGTAGQDGQPGKDGTIVDPSQVVKDITYPNDHEVTIYFYDDTNTTVSRPTPKAVDQITESGGDLEISYTDGTRKAIVLPAGSGPVQPRGKTVESITESGTNLVVTYTDGTSATLPLTSSTKPMPITADMVSRAIDHGDAPDTGSIKSLADGWWKIPFSNKGLTGRPTGTNGNDLIYFKQSVGNNGQDIVGLAFGEDGNGDASLWAQYRINGFWSKWYKEDGDGDAADIQKAIEGLQKGQTDMLAKLGDLKTEIGHIFAPDKASLDKEIQSQLASVENTIASMQARITALESGHHSGGGDHPLPSQVPHVFLAYGAQYPTTVQELGSVIQHSIGTITRSTQDSEYIYVSVVNTNKYADKVSGIVVDNGLSAVWGYKDATIEGTDYRIFQSPGKFFDQTNRVEVKFNS